MSKFYSERHRALQDRFDSRRLAEMMEQAIVHAEFAPHEQAFIESRDMFFLSTVDAEGRPTVSHKGGAAGFVRVAGPSTLVFPSYNGNGMFYSMGNIMSAPSVGLLFIDFETPNRLRVQGRAEVCFEHPLMGEYPQAECLVSVAVEQIWPNCARYIHKRRKVEDSRYLPEAGKEPALPGWKRIDIVQGALPAGDRERVPGEGGEISQEQYGELLAKGEG